MKAAGWGRKVEARLLAPQDNPEIIGPMSKHTVLAPSNIAFIKYWGARDLDRAIPTNPSISMTLRECYSHSTVEHLDEDGDDEIRWRGQNEALVEAPPSFAERVRAHLQTLRLETGCGGRFRVATENSFPAAAGIASSASGFAALTLATLGAVGYQASPEERSNLARKSGSGSASRSVLGGYVEWPRGQEESDCHAFQIAPAEQWDLRDVVALVETGPKEVSSLVGHSRARSSPYFQTRLEELPGRLATVREAIWERDFAKLARVVEAEAIDLHCIAMTSVPPIFYWQSGTLEVLAAVRTMRADGLDACATMDAGANVHVLCLPEVEAKVVVRLEALDAVRSTIRDGVGDGPRTSDEHLF